MTTGKGNIITGFIEGVITTSVGGPKMLPFGDKIGGATFRYQTESLSVETFSQQGVKGMSGACPFREMCSIELTSENLAWSFLQAATTTLAQNNDQPTPVVQSFVLSETTGTAPNLVSRITLTGVTVSSLAQVTAADEDGTQFTITAATAGSNTTITFDEDYTGQKVTVKWAVAATGQNDLIKLGSGTKIGSEVGVYGRFFGCPETYLIVIPRGNIDANLEMSVGDNPASAALTVNALRDGNGNFALIKRLT